MKPNQECLEVASAARKGVSPNSCRAGVWRRRARAALPGLILAGMAYCQAADATELITWAGSTAPSDLNQKAVSQVRAAIEKASSTPLSIRVMEQWPEKIEDLGEETVVCVLRWPADLLQAQGLAPVARLIHQNVAARQWVLLAGPEAGVSPRVGASLARRTLEPGDLELVERFVLRGQGISPQSSRMVEVSKSLDVLLALRSGQVELGLLERQDLEQLGRISPALVAGFRELARSPEISLGTLLVPVAQVGSPVVGRLQRALEDARPVEPRLGMQWHAVPATPEGSSPPAK